MHQSPTWNHKTLAAHKKENGRVLFEERALCYVGVGRHDYNLALPREPWNLRVALLSTELDGPS